MSWNKKQIIIVLLIAGYLLLMLAPGILSALFSIAGPFFPIIVYVIIMAISRGRWNSRRNKWNDSSYEQDVWEDNRDETERLGREIHDQSAILKRLYDIHYGAVNDQLFQRYHDAMYRVSRGECSYDILGELKVLVRAYSMYEDPEYRSHQKAQNNTSGQRSYTDQRGYEKTLFHPFLGKTKHFKDCEDFESAKKKYYKLMKETHPDNSMADQELCAELNSEFDSIQNYFHRK